MARFYPIFLLILLISCRNYVYEGCIKVFPYKFLGFKEKNILKISEISYLRKVENVVLHNTKDLSLKQYLQKSLSINQMSHYSIDKDGNIYGFDNPEKLIFKAVRALDYSAIHILIEGSSDETLENKLQIKALENLFFYISKKYKIEISNYDINSKKGFFTHLQAKKKFGNFVNLEECGGEEVIKKVFENLHETYYEEKRWKNRYRNWIVTYTGKKIKRDRKYKKYSRLKNEGRYITPIPEVSLLTVAHNDNFLIQKYRLQYSYLGNIPATCIVLHYTASNNLMSAFNTLERRNLSAHFMVDLDGTVYQLLDSPTRKAVTAAGTNNHCIQIEIVGLNSEKLIENRIQFYKVVELLNELSHKYKIPKNNHRVESFKGIFSHTQAKKKWGHSVYLDDTDFDPGEAYMKLILEALGGAYYEEKRWFKRKSDDWAIIFGDFQL